MPLTSPAPRLGGWLLLPLAWLILTVLTSALVVVMYIGALFNPAWRDALFSHDTAFLTQWGLSLATSLAVWLYSAWVTWIFCQRSRRLPRHYIIWLLLTVALALKTFADRRSPTARRCAPCCWRCWRRRRWCPIFADRSG